MCERFRRFLIPIALVFLLFGVCTPLVHAASTLQVAAAADLQPVLPALLETWKLQTGHAVQVSYGSSATLAMQIENGAPFDLFLSADMAFPERLVRGGRAADTAPTPYARGTLVLWARKDARLPPLSMKLLQTPAIRSIAIANPEHAPYGRAAMAALKSSGVFDTVQSRLRVAENVAQAAQFVESGNAQVGLISLTSALAPHLQSEGEFIEIPASLYPPILQGAVVLKGAQDAGAARALLGFLLSGHGRKQLQARGLKPPQ